MITLLTLDVHKEQIGITRAFLPLQNGICFTCPDFCCHCSILSVARGRRQALPGDGAEMLHASAPTDCWSSHRAEHHLLTKQTPCWNSTLNPNALASLGRLEPSQEPPRSFAFFSLLKESRSGLCSLAVLQNGLSWVLCYVTCFIFLQTWVTLLSQWVISFLHSLLHLPVAVLWENTWQIIII